MDFTSRMVALLGELRRERNGAVADAMCLCGKPYGLNYGVSLPTLRRIARAEMPDHDFARYLYVQDVRELRLAALYIAQPERVTMDEADFWAAGIINSEVAEEASFALLSRVGVLPELFRSWITASPLLQYAALLAAARSPQASLAWVDAALEAVHRNAVEAEALVAAARSVAAADTSAAPAAGIAGAAGQAASASFAARAARLVAQGAVALCVAVGSQNEENRLAVHRKAGSLGKLPAEDCVHEELAWRLEP
ncbi:DNA alkylation repair protein [uncultured Alistipes sp.]|uniref:DNA alkylation repair protein n=1 Tax=uncultured Alistipes sp. TaxID=538949 RepID=UPI002664E8FD|nr:DNA alkylation repair protein [uncultured Alistipes sp.]